MRKRRWLIPLLTTGAVLLYRTVRHVAGKHVSRDLQAFHVPNARSYDTLSTLLFGSFYDKVARELASRQPTGTVLDVGSGPGNLAVRLAELAPQLVVVGIDISPDMVERARHRASMAGVSDRVRFEVGDVAQLPHVDGYFDLVASTFSLHHWPDPERGLAEIYRVVKPGGHACIYDLSGQVLRAFHHRRGIEQAVKSSPFRDRTIEVFRWPWSIPAIRRVCLRRAADS